jgi:hypothetical protein
MPHRRLPQLLACASLFVCAGAAAAVDTPFSIWGGVARFEQEGKEIGGEYGLNAGVGFMQPGGGGLLGGAAGSDIDWRHGSDGDGRIDVVHLCYVERFRIDPSLQLYFGLGIGTAWTRIEDERGGPGAERREDDWAWGVKALVGLPFTDAIGLEASWLATEPTAGVTTTGFSAALKFAF